MWSDDFIWVQPVAEKSRDEIFAATIIGDIDCENLYLVLEGVRQENRYAYSYPIFTFAFIDSLWKPCNPELVPDIQNNIYTKYNQVHLQIDGALAVERG